MTEQRPLPEHKQGDLLERIQERYGTLRKSERIVADFLRNNAGKRLDSSITELGRTLGVSEATISRVSRALGYDGYPDMKLSLAEGTRNRSSIVNLPLEIDDSDSLISTSNKLASLLIAGLAGTQRMLDAHRLEQAVEALRLARKIVFVGVGGAAAICDEAAHMFMKAGFDATSYRDGYTQTIVAATLTADDVMVGISHTGSTETVTDALLLAREKKATTIAITSNADSDVGRAGHVVLTTWSADQHLVPLHGDFLEGRASQLFLIDLLYVGALFRNGDGPATALKTTGEALEKRYRKKRGTA
ncbi:MurR/RpiR family transcriptional regulator [Rhizobium sp. SG2393]|uniref:MurR/RpiR family transcriptional regulator n=1 Tax=Rhizobium sp. SG2393 TaxID=3276279 RepID=UPI00366C84B2